VVILGQGEERSGRALTCLVGDVLSGFGRDQVPAYIELVEGYPKDYLPLNFRKEGSPGKGEYLYSVKRQLGKETGLSLGASFLGSRVVFGYGGRGGVGIGNPLSLGTMLFLRKNLVGTQGQMCSG